MFKSLLSSCVCNRGTPVVERDMNNEDGAMGQQETIGQTQQSVYYDTRESLSETGSGFVCPCC